MARAKPPPPEQGALFKGSEISNLARQFTPVSTALEGARAYQSGRGQRFRTAGLGDLQVNPQRGHATFLAYRNAMQAPQNPEIAQSYGALREHVSKQYDYMTRPKEQGGMGLRHEVTGHDPYKTPQEMAADMAKGRIQTWTSASTPHEYFTPEENDRFRAVHDVFGHGAIGRGFSRHGEEAAYLSHRQMFPPEAHAALASETRGQNSYLNYSPENQFPSQKGKLIGLPKWAASRTSATPTSRRTRRRGAQQLSFF
jgi:hypothetical protein